MREYLFATALTLKLLTLFGVDVSAQVTKRISLNSAGAASDRASSWPRISGDGRFVVFSSNSNNLAPDANTGFEQNVYFRDLQTGITNRISSKPNGQITGFESTRPSISEDGRYVVFDSVAPTLVTGDSNSMQDIFLRDIVQGTTQRVNLTNTGLQGSADPSVNGSISGNGRYVSFCSRASNLVVGDTNLQYDVFVRDLFNQTTTRISVNSSGGQARKSITNSEGDFSLSALSADGRFVAFSSTADTLVDGDTNGIRDIFVRDQTANTTTRVSVASDGTQAIASTGLFASLGSENPAISADGRFIAFSSYSPNLVAGDVNNDSDIFIRDTVAGTTTLVSRNSVGQQSPKGSFQPALSGDGNYIAFVSKGTFDGAEVDLEEDDVFLKNLTTGVVQRVTVKESGKDTAQGGGAPSLSYDGRLVAFSADASLLPGAEHNGDDIFLFDRSQVVITPVPVITSSISKSGEKRLSCTVKLSKNAVTNKSVTAQTSATATGTFSRVGSAKTDKKGVAVISIRKVAKNRFVRCSYDGQFSVAKKVTR